MRNTLKYIALSFIPLSMLIALMYYYASDIPFVDEWMVLHMLEKLKSGTLTFWDIFAHHNEHRIITTKIVLLLNAVLTGWNIYYELAVNVLLAVGSSIIIYYAVNKLELDSPKKMILYFTCACMIFSFSQQECIMWGSQMQLLMSVFFSLLAIVLLAYGAKLSIFASVACAVLATYSFANGMLVWPAGLAVLIMRDRKIPVMKIIMWLAFAAAFIGLYFWGYESSSTAEKITLSAKIKSLILHPHMFILLFATYLGAPLANYRQSLALFFGLVVIGVNIWCFIRLLRGKIARDNNSGFWLGADVYILLSAALTAYGRQGTISTTMALRYMSLQVLSWIITPCIFFMTLEKIRHVPIKIYILVAMLIISHSVSEDALVRARERYDGLNLVSRQLNAGIIDIETLKRYTGVGNKEIAAFPKLKTWGVKFLQNTPDVIEFDGFRKIPLNMQDFHMSANTSCAVDELVTDGKFLSVKGWWQIDNFSEHDKTHSLTFIILCNDDGAYEAVLDKWQGIPSIRAARNSNIFDTYKQYIFGGTAYFGNVKGGKYRVMLRVHSHEGKDYYFPTGKLITINI